MKRQKITIQLPQCKHVGNRAGWGLTVAGTRIPIHAIIGEGCASWADAYGVEPRKADQIANWLHKVLTEISDHLPDDSEGDER
jgi:hypothetical protein